MPVPNTFANATATIPLSQLDANFATTITLGNTAIQLGNTVTTLNDMTLANVNISSGIVTITNASVTTANVTTANIATAEIANVTVSGTGTFAAGSNTAPSITTSGDTNTGIFFPAADTIAFTEGGVESMRIDASGNVGIGTTSPALPIDVVSNSSSLALSIRGRSSDDIGTLMYYTNNGATNTAQIQMRPNDNEFRFLALGARSLVFYTNGSERMRVNPGAPILCLSGGNTSATGTGIAFPATQNASSDANTLDDYEEGTWTPVLGGSSGNPTVTYATQEGVYTKVGNLVTVSGRIILTARSGGSGTAELRGLPFTVGATNNIFVGAVTLSAVDFGVNTKYAVSRALSGSTYLILEECNDNAVSNTIQVSAIGATADIIVNFSYRV